MPCVFRCLLLFCLVWATLSPSAGAAAADHWQRKLSWPARPARIVSLSPATTEMLYAMGAEKQLVGVTDDCNYPAAAAQKKRLGRFGQIQLEKIIQLKPDLIVGTADMGQALTPLKRLPVPLLAFKTPHLAAIETNLLELGRVTGRLSQAQAQVDLLKSRQAKLVPLTRRPGVLYLVWHEPLMTATPSGFIGQVLERAGGRNVVGAHKAPFIHYSLESLVKADPEVLILPASLKGKVAFAQAPFNRLKAVKRQQILFLNDDLISRPGPRVIQALEQIHHYLRGLKP